MPLSKEELARRLKTARQLATLTQADVATELGIARSAVAEIESGRRSISGLELERFAYVVGRDMRDFLADDFSEEDVLSALFRAQPEVVESGAVLPRLRHCLVLARELQNLERLAGVERTALLGTSYAAAVPRTKWDAIQQGERAAVVERQRLGLGKSQLGDLVQILESQGIRTATVDLPDDVSGLTIAPDSSSAFVAVNKSHHVNRLRFSFAHEYCHVLFDRDTRGQVSRSSERDDLREVRANAFAATMLMPEEGVLDAVEALGKGRPSRQATSVFDGDEAVSAESRAEPGSQDIQYYDVLQLAALFVVSPLAMIYRLKNLRLVSDAELEQLREQDTGRRAAELGRLMQMPDDNADQTEPSGAHAVFQRRFIGLGFEVFRRGKITHAKLRELALLIDIDRDALDAALDAAGLNDNAPLGAG